MSDDSTSLELRSVVQRFNDSNEVLAQLRERLQSLADTEDAQSASAQSLTATSEQLRSYAVQVEEATTGLHAALAATEGAMGVAQEFLKGTDLNAVRGDLSQIEACVREVAGGNEELQASTLRIIEILERELVAARAETAQAVNARQQLEAKIAAVPEKSRRKLGL